MWRWSANSLHVSFAEGVLPLEERLRGRIRRSSPDALPAGEASRLLVDDLEVVVAETVLGCGEKVSDRQSANSGDLDALPPPDSACPDNERASGSSTTSAFARGPRAGTALSPRVRVGGVEGIGSTCASRRD